MDRPKGSGGDEGDPPPLPPIKKEIIPTPTKGETTLTREPVKIEVTKKKWSGKLFLFKVNNKKNNLGWYP